MGSSAVRSNQFAAGFRTYPASGAVERTHKSGERMYARIIRARSSKARKSHEPGRAVILAGNPLALVCLVIGAALAVFVSGSFEQRIGNLLVFGLMPAVGLYAACPHFRSA